ncbi:MAG: hypothetical protein ACKPB3_06280, partial [Bacteroidota bacterium]
STFAYLYNKLEKSSLQVREEIRKESQWGFWGIVNCYYLSTASLVIGLAYFASTFAPLGEKPKRSSRQVPEKIHCRIANIFLIVLVLALKLFTPNVWKNMR